MCQSGKTINNVIDTLPWHPTRKWGFRPPEYVERIIVHQSLSHGADTEDLNRYHIGPNHICSIGCPHLCYHYSLERNGAIYHCNDLTSIVWHTKGQNMHSIGIVLCGDFDGPSYDGQGEPTKKQMDSLEWLINRTRVLFGRELEVRGHSYYGKENCPGTLVDRWLDTRYRNEDEKE